MKQENKIEFLDKETSANYDAISPITGNNCVLIEAEEMTKFSPSLRNCQRLLLR